MSMESIIRRRLGLPPEEPSATASRTSRKSSAKRPRVPEYDAGPERRADWDIRDYNWWKPGVASKYGTTDEALQAAYGRLSDVDRIRVGYGGPSMLMDLGDIPFSPASRPPAVDFGPSGSGPAPGPAPPPSPFDPGFDPLPVPSTLPPEDPPVAPAPPPMPWVDQTPSPAAPPVTAPAPAPPISPSPSPAPAPAPSVSHPPPAQPTPAPVGGTGTNVGPGPYPPWLGGQPTWGNPTDPYLLPFSPGSILPPGQGGQPPSWWNEILSPYQISPPRWPTTYNNPYLGNAGGFSVGSPYFAPFSSWGFYPMSHMSQHMPGSFGMATPGMGSWYTGSPVGFNPTPGQQPIGAPQAYSTPPQGPTAATNPQTTGAPATSWTGVNAMPSPGNMAGVQTMQRPNWMNYGGMFVGRGF